MMPAKPNNQLARNRGDFRSIGFTAAALATASAPCAAGTFHYRFFAQIEQIEGSFAGTAFAAASVGSIVSVLIEVSDAALDSNPSPNLGSYDDAITSLTYAFGADMYAFAFNVTNMPQLRTNQITVADGGYDEVQFVGADYATGGSGWVFGEIRLNDPQGLALSSDSIPDSLDHNDFGAPYAGSHVRWSIDWDGDGENEGIWYASFVDVPTPVAGSTTAVGLALSGVMRRRRCGFSSQR